MTSQRAASRRAEEDRRELGTAVAVLSEQVREGKDRGLEQRDGLPSLERRGGGRDGTSEPPLFIQRCEGVLGGACSPPPSCAAFGPGHWHAGPQASGAFLGACPCGGRDQEGENKKNF